MLSLKLQEIKDLRLNIAHIESAASSGLLARPYAITVIKNAMTRIERLQREYVDERHHWAKHDKLPRIKKRRGETITYYMTRIKRGKTLIQLTASSLEALYIKLYKFYTDDTALDLNNSTTVKQLYEIYREIRRKDADYYHTISSRTADNTEMDWKRFFSDSRIIDTKVINVTQRQILSEYKRITGSGNITRKAFSKAKGLLDAMFDVAIESGIIDNSPSRGVPTKNLKFKLANDNSSEVYTIEERNTLMRYLQSLHTQTVYTLAIQLSFCFCLRSGELRALTWEDYDKDNKTIFIWHQIVECKKNGKNRVSTDVPFTKTNTQEGKRLLYVSDEAAKIIEQLRAINGNKKYILNSSGNNPITGAHFNERLKKYCKRAGISYYSSHKIRFYGATELFNAGVDPE